MKVAIDIGGTFTDVLALDDAGSIASAKLPTRPEDLAGCFRAGVEAACTPATALDTNPDELLYSTTLALNSLLGHQLPRIGLIVNRGFRELLETARLPAREGSEEAAHRPAARLVPLEHVREVGARMDADGRERTPVDAVEVARLAVQFREQGIATIAVSLLHSYADASHEREIGRIFAASTPDAQVMLSSEVLPELREYERTLATCLNACLVRLMGGHLERVAEGNPESRLSIMRSSGGLASARSTLRRPLATALSGTSAAVVGMAWLGQQIGFANLITLDVGGTSTDVALVRDGQYATTTAGEIAGFPFKTPMIDSFTVGAGGGSVACEGADQRWRVGPESAGAVPGPICYGAGASQVTLTDAQLALGRLPPSLLGGALPLDSDAALKALDAFGAARGVGALDAARGILEIATHNMVGAIRRVSVLRGQDPRDYALIATGGAGPLHAAELAVLLGIETVVVPPKPGFAAAMGLLVADVREDFAHAYGQLDDAVDLARVRDTFDPLERAADRFLADEEIGIGRRTLRRSIDMRYAGMLYETSITLVDGALTRGAITEAVESFHAHFERVTGHSHRGDEAVELVNLRVTAIGEREKPTLPRLEERADAADRVPQLRETRQVGYLHHRALLNSGVFDRAGLAPGTTLSGPAVIEEAESTLIVPPEFSAQIDPFGNVLLRASGERES